MNLVEPVDAWYSDLFHGHFLYPSDYFLPFVYILGHGARCIEDGAHLVLGYDFAEFFFVQYEFSVTEFSQDIDGEFGHLSHLFLESHP